MDIIKLIWGLLFNELTHNDKCENINNCEKKLNEYLNYLRKYIPQYLDKYKSKKEMIKQSPNKLNIYKMISNIAFGTIKLTVYGLSMIYCPQLTFLIIGDINAEEIVNL